MAGDQNPSLWVVNQKNLWNSENYLKKEKLLNLKSPPLPPWNEAYQAYLTELIAELEFQIYWKKQLRQIPAWIWNSPDNFFEPPEPETKTLTSHA